MSLKRCPPPRTCASSTAARSLAYVLTIASIAPQAAAAQLPTFRPLLSLLPTRSLLNQSPDPLPTVDLAGGGYGSDDIEPGYGGPAPPDVTPPADEQQPMEHPAPLRPLRPLPGPIPTSEAWPGPGPIPEFSEGDLRLVGRLDVNGFATGALQLYHDGGFAAVCATDFGTPDAAVACRQLGFASGVAIRPLPASISEVDAIDLAQDFLAPFAVEHLGCTGDEERLLDCPVAEVAAGDRPAERSYLYDDYGPEGCSAFPASRANNRQTSYAFVACGLGEAAEEGDIRLAEGGTSEFVGAEFGRLEIFVNGGWGTFCNLRDPLGFFADTAPFTPESATVACQQLGFNNGMQIQSQEDFDFGRPTNVTRIPIAVAGAECDGSEATLLDCPRGLPERRRGPRVGPCDHNDDVYLVCFPEPPPGDGEVRLEGGELVEEHAYGRLEIFLRGFWSDVCSTEKFTPASARVACRQLGYDGGAGLLFPRPYEFGGRFVDPNLLLEAYLPVGLAAVDCAGNERSLAACPFDASAIPRCNNGTDSTVLACGNTDTGCGITIQEAEGAVRLVGGFGTPCDPLYTGIVEIFHAGEWGVICGGRLDPTDSPFGTLAPDVICRQLGFPHGTVVDGLEPGNTDNVEESQLPLGRIWLRDLLCRGPEERVLDCDLVPRRFLRRRDEASFGSCGFSERRLNVACRQFAVEPALEAVTTPDAEEGDLRLLEEESVTNWVTGELQIFFEGSWSQVCATNFDDRDAAVACRQLGYSAGSVAADFEFRPGQEATDAVDAEVAITNPGCNGREDSLLDCEGQNMLRRTTSRECQSSRSFPLRLACVVDEIPGEEGELRLRTLDGASLQPPGADSGIPEIFHAGAWGTFCRSGRFRPPGEYADYDFPFQPDPDNAVVLCRQLGFEDGVMFSIEPETLPADASLAPPWLGGFRCDGTEESVLDCNLPGFGNTVTCGPPQRLFCSPVEAAEGTARLVGGSADPVGTWEYGRLEIVFGGFWTTLSENNDQALGRRGAEVACRSLGYAAGAQMYAGNASPLRGDGVDARAAGALACTGEEETLAQCDGLSTRRGPFEDASIRGGIYDVVVMCTNPSGCKVGQTDPVEGDVRLVPLSPRQPATAVCDAVHFGGVEIFHNGQWGRICTTDLPGGREASQMFTLDAQVVCRQLGFRFGGIYDVEEFRQSDFIPGDDVDDVYPDDYEAGIAFATEVTCTGKEARLDECFFPESFGDNDPSVTGVVGTCTTERRAIFSVVCREFEISESNLIR